MHNDISTTTRLIKNPSDFSVSHRREELIDTRCDNIWACDLRDLGRSLVEQSITKAFDGHMRTDGRWPTSVFHECRRNDELLKLFRALVDGIDGLAVPELDGGTWGTEVLREPESTATGGSQSGGR